MRQTTRSELISSRVIRGVRNTERSDCNRSSVITASHPENSPFHFGNTALIRSSWHDCVHETRRPFKGFILRVLTARCASAVVANSIYASERVFPVELLIKIFNRIYSLCLKIIWEFKNKILLLFVKLTDPW